MTLFWPFILRFSHNFLRHLFFVYYCRSVKNFIVKFSGNVCLLWQLFENFFDNFFENSIGDCFGNRLGFSFKSCFCNFFWSSFGNAMFYVFFQQLFRKYFRMSCHFFLGIPFAIFYGDFIGNILAIPVSDASVITMISFVNCFA